MLSLITLGGTISMLNDSSKGVIPLLGAKELASTFKDIKAIDYAKVASPNVDFKMLLEVLQIAKEEVKNGSKGIIISQGTDTLEESAFFMQLLWDLEEPLVFTGAMKSPSELGSDYLANLEDAILVANSDLARGLGVLCVLNKCVHSANYIHKSNTFSLETFTSGVAGLVGQIVENKLYIFNNNIKRFKFNAPKNISKKVALIKLYQDFDDELLEFSLDKFDAVVFSGYGAGHLMQRSMPLIKNCNKTLVMASRCEQGRVGEQTYAYAGAEIDLIDNGVLMSGFLSDLKARILLILALENNLLKDEINKIIQSF